MQMRLIFLFVVATSLWSIAQVDPPVNARRKSWWVETRFDEPDVMIVHRNGREMRVQRISGGGEEGGPVVIQGPSEISMKWVGPPEPWPDGITVVDDEILHDGVVLVKLAFNEDPVAAAAILASMPSVRYAYPVEYTDPMFARIMPTDQIITSLSNGVDVAEIEGAFGLEAVTNMIGSTSEFVLRLVDPKSVSASNVVEALIGSGLVDWAQRDCLREGEFFGIPNDTNFGNQWHMNATGQTIGTLTAPVDVDVNAASAWNTTTGGGSVIAVVDDAVQTNHPDLVSNIAPAGLYDFYFLDDDPSPDTTTDGHGTACAGVAAASGNNMLGVAGMAYGSTIVPVKICGNGIFPNDSTVAQGVRHAAFYADIVTCSWGYYNPAPVTRSAVQYALQSGAGGRGSVVYFAAGNDGGFIPSSLSLGAAPANYNFRWRYTKDAANAGGLDKCFVDSIWYPNGGTEMFDTTGVGFLPAGWTSGFTGAGSPAWWSVAPQSAGSRAESGGYGLPWQFIESSPITDNQSVYAQVAANDPTGGSSLWYYMRVSAEPTVYSGNQQFVYDYGQIEYQVVGSPSWSIANIQGGQPAALSYPAQYPETVAVGANDWTSRRSHYSQWSGELDFVAPSDGDWAGLGIETTDLTGGNGYDTGNYCQAASVSSKFGGTSSAAPLAAGIGALVRSAFTMLSPAQVRNVMRKSCRQIDPTWYTYSGMLNGRDQYVGWGQVDASNALVVAASEPPVAQIAMDLKITEVSPLDAVCPFVEIFNNSTVNAYTLETLMLTDCETGGDETESSYMFPPQATVLPQAAIIPPQGMVVVALGAATPGLINELTSVIASGSQPAGGIELFECIPSGLLFKGNPVWSMISPINLPSGLTLGANDNITLVVTPGMQASYLPDVVDGMSYGMPVVTPNCAIGAAPSIPEMGPIPASASSTSSYQRNGVVDTDTSIADFVVAPRTPGWVAYGAPVSSFVASPLISTANEMVVTPDPTVPIIMIAASIDPLFDHPVQGAPPLAIGALLGADVIVYHGPVVPGMPLVDMGIPPLGPYVPGTPVYYRVWSVTSMGVDYYSAGVDSSATTLPLPMALPFADNFDSAPVLNTTLWPYTLGATVDAGGAFYFAPVFSPPNCAQMDNSSGTSPRMDTTNIDASTTPNVKVTYALAEMGFGPGDPPDEPLEVQVLDPTLTWQTVFIHPPSGGPTPFMSYEHPIDPGMLHNEFRVRFVSQSMILGPADLDHWFIDDVTVEEFPVLSGFQWQTIPAGISAGIPFSAQVTALSSMGGTFTNYAGTPSVALFATNGAPSSAVDPDPLSGFTSGVWSNDLTIAGEDALHVVLVADEGGVTGTSSVFKVYDDIDADLILDSWEWDWFGSVNVASNSPATDWDNDLFPDYSEFVAGTCPTNPLSYLYLTVPLVEPGVSNVVVWPSVSNRVYDIWRNTNLVSGGWIQVSVSNMPATPPINLWVDTSSPSNQSFYKVKASQKK